MTRRIGIELVVMALPAGAEPQAEWLSCAERERAARFRFAEHRRRYIASHAALRALLGSRCGSAPGALRIEAGERGKPSFAGSPWQFSLARSRNLAAFAFARERAVGVDIEAIAPIAQADEIARRTFALEQWRAYEALPAREKPLGFFRGWTRTEALAKALGGGLGLPQAALDAALERGWIVAGFTPAPGYVGALAAAPAGARP